MGMGGHDVGLAMFNLSPCISPLMGQYCNHAQVPQKKALRPSLTFTCRRTCHKSVTQQCRTTDTADMGYPHVHFASLVESTFAARMVIVAVEQMVTILFSTSALNVDRNASHYCLSCLFYLLDRHEHSVCGYTLNAAKPALECNHTGRIVLSAGRL